MSARSSTPAPPQAHSSLPALPVSSAIAPPAAASDVAAARICNFFMAVSCIGCLCRFRPRAWARVAADSATAHVAIRFLHVAAQLIALLAAEALRVRGALFAPARAPLVAPHL